MIGLFPIQREPQQREQSVMLTPNSPRTTPKVRWWLSTLAKRRSRRVCQQKCCGTITSSTPFRLKRFEPWHALELPTRSWQSVHHQHVWHVFMER